MSYKHALFMRQLFYNVYNLASNSVIQFKH